MTTGYFVIMSGEDGMTIRGPLTSEDLRRKLEPYPGEKHGYFGELHFLDEVPTIDKGCMMFSERKGKPCILIKGEIVVPRAVEVVTKIEVP